MLARCGAPFPLLSMKHELFGVPFRLSKMDRIDSLTGLRFIAALHVVLFHRGQWLFSEVAAWIQSQESLRALVGPSALDSLAGAIVRFGNTGSYGVTLFFILSGFILVYTYYQQVVTGQFSKSKFWVARFARIYPIYLTALASMLPFMVYSVCTGNQAPSTILLAGALNATLIQAWFPPYALSWNAPGWSLSVEAFFYVMFPFLIAWLARFPPRQVLLGAGCFCLLTAGLVQVATTSITPSIAWTECWNNFLLVFPLLRLSEFTLGMAVGLAIVREPRSAMPLSRNLLVSAALLSLGLLSSGHLVFGETACGILLPFSFALLIYCLARAGRVSILGSSAMVLLGEASYALYILHIPVAKYFISISRHTSPTNQFIGLTLGLYLLIAVAVSIVAFKWVERPARNWLKHHLRTG